jgi:hypothetical protein
MFSGLLLLSACRNSGVWITSQGWNCAAHTAASPAWSVAHAGAQNEIQRRFSHKSHHHPLPAQPVELLELEQLEELDVAENEMKRFPDVSFYCKPTNAMAVGPNAPTPHAVLVFLNSGRAWHAKSAAAESVGQPNQSTARQPRRDAQPDLLECVQEQPAEHPRLCLQPFLAQGLACQQQPYSNSSTKSGKPCESGGPSVMYIVPSSFLLDGPFAQYPHPSSYTLMQEYLLLSHNELKALPDSTFRLEKLKVCRS